MKKLIIIVDDWFIPVLESPVEDNDDQRLGKLFNLHSCCRMAEKDENLSVNVNYSSFLT